MIFILAFLSQVWGQSLPSEIYQVDSIFKLTHQPFINKMVQLKQNLIEESGEDFQRFYDAKPIICPQGQKVLGRQSAVELSYWSNASKTNLSEEINFKGCSQTMNFTMEVSSVGENLEPIGFKTLRSFDFELKLRPNEKVKDYIIRLRTGQQVLRIYQERTGNMVSTDIYFQNNRIMTLDETRNEKTIEQLVTTRSYDVEVNYNKGRWRLNESPHNPETMTVNYHIKENYSEIRNNTRQLISVADYQKQLTDNELGALVNMNNYLFATLDAEFPTTQFVNSGQQNAKLLEELRNIQAMLISGTQLNLVRNYIQEYIKAAQEGQLEDRRPRKDALQK